MTNTANLSLPNIAAAQSQKHVTHNEGLRILDALIYIRVLDDDLTAPPVGVEGARYIVAATATGDWAGQENKIAAFQDGSWRFYTPSTAWIVWVHDETTPKVWSGTAWVSYLGQRAPNGGFYEPVNRSGSTTLTGGTTNLGLQIPNGSWIAGVSARVTTLITGCASWSLGVSGDTGRFGSSLGLSAGTTNFGITGGQAYYADTNVVATAVGGGGSFSAGVISYHIYGWRCTPPTS